MKPIISAVAIAGLFSMAACNTPIQDKDAAILAQKRTIDSMNIELAKKKVVDSMNEVSKAYVFPGITTPTAMVQRVKQTPVTVVKRTVVSRNNYVSRAHRSYRSSYSGYRYAPAPVVYQQPVQYRRRGWSAKAKGAVIGAGTGAVLGAVVNGRNRLAGGVIGSLIGAGAGTGIGAIIDHRHGR